MRRTRSSLADLPISARQLRTSTGRRYAPRGRWKLKNTRAVAVWARWLAVVRRARGTWLWLMVRRPGRLWRQRSAGGRMSTCTPRRATSTPSMRWWWKCRTMLCCLRARSRAWRSWRRTSGWRPWRRPRQMRARCLAGGLSTASTSAACRCRRRTRSRRRGLAWTCSLSTRASTLSTSSSSGVRRCGRTCGPSGAPPPTATATALTSRARRLGTSGAWRAARRCTPCACSAATAAGGFRMSWAA
mmetsp:Transcript_26464/g.92041  ORF Transcript_26464/g.92041 Transcript_26464/m.92041 type:complete len:244 (+) Transcript_26464:277-1008(+)